MSDQGWLSYARDLVDIALTEQEGWADIVVDLRSEGIEEEVIRAVLREHRAWYWEAREWKYRGHPYEEIVRYLRDEVAAEWGDVAHALLEVELTPADMLRVVLPLLGEDSPVPVLKVGSLATSVCSEEGEAWNVAVYYVTDESDLAAVVDDLPD